MRVIVEHDCGTVSFLPDIHPWAALVLGYYGKAKSVGLGDSEIAEDLGGVDIEDDEGSETDLEDGLVPWAGGCEIIDDTILLFAPWDVAVQGVGIGLDGYDIAYMRGELVG